VTTDRLVGCWTLPPPPIARLLLRYLITFLQKDSGLQDGPQIEGTNTLGFLVGYHCYHG